MKKKNLIAAITAFLTVIALFLTGCQKNGASDNPFRVFSEDFSAALSVEINGNPSACDCEKRGEGAKITLVSPSALSGFSFTVNNERTSLKTGDVEVEAEGRIGLLPRLLFSVFSENRENITEIKTEKSGGAVFTVIKTGNAVYRFGKDGTPLSAEGVFSGAPFKITFSSFTAAKDGVA